MTDPEQQDEGSPGGGQFADPNREAVGVEPAWAEGSGGSDTSAGSGGGGAVRSGDQLEDMTKDELIEEASARGVDVNQQMNKAEIRAAIEEA